MPGIAFRLQPHVVLMLRGDRALAFLQDVSAQEVASLAPGSGAHAAFLDPKGRVLADAIVLAGEGEALLVAEQACESGLERAVARVAPLAGVSVEAITVEAARLVAPAGPEVPAAEHSWVRRGDVVLVRVSWGGEGVLALGSAETVSGLVADAGAAWGDPAQAEYERIGGGRPRFGVDVTEDTLVNETPLLERAVAADKGCYPGQESVARVRNLGRIRRRLAVLEGAPPPPAAGEALLADGAEVGVVTSAVALDGRVAALGYVPADLEPDVAVRAGEAELRLKAAIRVPE